MKTAPKATKENGSKGEKSCCMSFTPSKQLPLSKFYMKVSCNTQHGADKKAVKFWEGIALHYQEQKSTISLRQMWNIFSSTLLKMVSPSATVGNANFNRQFQNFVELLLGTSLSQTR
jgi:hypothetical protein